MTAQHATERAQRQQSRPYTSTDMVGFLRYVQERFEAYAATFDPSQTAEDIDEVAARVDLATRWIEETEGHVEGMARDLDISRAAHQASDSHAQTMEDRVTKLQARVMELESINGEFSALRAEASALREENRALQAWKESKLKSDTSARDRRERDALAAGVEAARKARELEVQQLKNELSISRAECEQLKQREAAISEREKRFERSTQSFLADRARNAVARDEKPKILVITTTRICEAVPKEQDPVKVLPGPDYFSFLYGLSLLGIEHAPKHTLLDPVVKYVSGGNLEAAPDARKVLQDARVWMHRVALTMEEVTKQSAFFQTRLQLREQSLRAAVDGMGALRAETSRLLGVLQAPSK